MAEQTRSQSPSSDESGEEAVAPVNLNEDVEWDDVETDEEEDIEITSFFGAADGTFKNAKEMIEHCRTKHGLDFAAAIRDFDLDFYGAIKLVNYIRASAAASASVSIPGSKDVFANDKYLQPVLEGDALLFSLDDVIAAANPPTASAAASAAGLSPGGTTAELLNQLRAVEAQFAAYRATVAETLDKRWAAAEGTSSTDTAAATHDLPPRGIDNDSHYFQSYSYTDIHETMLKDTVRTDAYRDFIYTNKALFHGKTVLDVGCGTGILSMFAARAGAAHVFAVDNSPIATTARDIVAANNLSDRITVVQANVDAPPGSGALYPLRDLAGKADVLVSEWMGYCLLYEGMLDSVLAARDRFLRPGGLMAPSHAVLRLAPLSDPGMADDAANFWAGVYGFDMRALRARPPLDVRVQDVEPRALCGAPAAFLRLDLARCSAADLSFTKEFECAVTRDVEALDGFALWFDVFFFEPAEGDALRGMWDTPKAHAENWPAFGTPGSVGFTTGPGNASWRAPRTHWSTGVLAVDRWNDEASVTPRAPTPVAAGSKVRGTVAYRKRGSNARELEIEVAWTVVGKDGETIEQGTQVWIMH